jgi:hypothetical protein
MAKEVVITIHGVNPDRGWQPAIRDVLKPHFEVLAHRYPDYDTAIGPVRAVADIWLLAISAVAFLLFLYSVVSGHWWNAAVAAFAFAVLFPLCLMFGWGRRVVNTKRLMRYISEKAQSGSPHVIAHSLGTYLVGGVIRKYTGVTFGRVLLVSCVLPRDFPWARTVKERPRSVRSVRNEFGTSDRVVKAVGRIRWLVRDLGTAGDLGFHEMEGLIHTSPSPVAVCPACGAPPVRVHNVPLREYGHSEVFLGRRHARELWLPFLWGFPADELNGYLEDLRVTAELIRGMRWNEAEKIINRLFGTCFTWTHGMTLKDSVMDVVKGRISLGLQLPDGLSVERVVSEVRLTLPVITADALAESVRPNPDEKIAWPLHPNNAIAKVVDNAIKAREANQP